MMRNVLRPAALAATLLLGTLAMTEARAADDPYAWMEEIEGARALDWAKAENARSLPRLQNDPRYAGLYAGAQAIATAPDRIPGIAFAGGERVRDFWQDRTHVRGLWRETDLAGYRSGTPAWRTVLDIDALAMVSRGVNALRDAGRGFVVITHYDRLLAYLEPDFVHVRAAGRIVRSGGRELAQALEARGYGWLEGGQ